MESSGNQTRKIRKERSQAQKDAQRRYYEKNREKRLTQMRLKAAERAEALREQIQNDPEALQEARAKMMEKYYRYVEGQNNRLVAKWLKSDDDVLAKWVAKFIVPQRHSISRATYNALESVFEKRLREADGAARDAEIPEFNFC